MNNVTPHNEEYEQIILGTILAEDGSNTESIAGLKESDFYIDKHKLIFRTIVKMMDQNIPVDIVTLRDELDKDGYLDKIGGSACITYLTVTIIPRPNIDYFIEEIKKAAQLREIWEESHKIINSIEEGKNLEDILKLSNNVGENELYQNSSKLKLLSAKALADIPPPNSIWGNIIFEESITQINSAPGVGKTTLCYNLAAFGANREEFLDLPFYKKLKVLYLDAETPQGLRKLKLLNICEELPESLFFMDGIDFRKDYLQLLSICKRDKYDLLVFDTMSRIIGFENENDNAEANNVMSLIRRLTTETKCSVILIHHTSKTEESKGVYRGRGASAISASVDVVVNLEELDEEVLKLKVEKNRFLGNKTEILLKKVGEDRFEQHYKENGVKHDGYEIFEAQKLIRALPTNQELKTGYMCEICTDEGFTKRTAERALSGLAQSGKLTKIRRGVYMIKDYKVSDISDTSARHNPDGTVGMAEVME